MRTKEQQRAAYLKCYAKNKDRFSARSRAYYAANKEKECARNRAKRIEKEFGLTPAAYNEMLEKQNGVCAICRQCCTKNNFLSVDHNHTTGAVRGLLCSPCNLLIGNAREKQETLQAAIAYLQETN